MIAKLVPGTIELAHFLIFNAKMHHVLYDLKLDVGDFHQLGILAHWLSKHIVSGLYSRHTVLANTSTHDRFFKQPEIRNVLMKSNYAKKGTKKIKIICNYWWFAGYFDTKNPVKYWSILIGNAYLEIKKYSYIVHKCVKFFN